MKRVLGLLLTLLLALGTIGAAQAKTPAGSDLPQLMARAAREFGVPTPVVMAVSFAETRWEDHGSEPSSANGYGVMHLQDNPYNQGLVLASELLGVDVTTLKTDMAQNIRGGAALLKHFYLASYPDDPDMKRAGDLNRWFEPVGRYLQSQSNEKARDFADYVYEVLGNGVTASDNSRGITLAGIKDLKPDLGSFKSTKSRMERLKAAKANTSATASTVPEAGADIWDPSSNFDSADRGVGDITEVVIHTCQGGYTGCISTLKDTRKDWCKPGDPTVDCRVSAHYVVRSSDGYVTQLVRDKDIAWHATTHNSFSVGIEHEGWVDDPKWYTDTMYRESAWVSAWRLYYYDLSVYDIVAHSSFDPNKGDPGSYWNWGTYLSYVQQRLDMIREIEP